MSKNYAINIKTIQAVQIYLMNSTEQQIIFAQSILVSINMLILFPFPFDVSNNGGTNLLRKNAHNN